jgi:hypothetical protein
MHIQAANCAAPHAFNKMMLFRKAVGPLRKLKMMGVGRRLCFYSSLAMVVRHP